MLLSLHVKNLALIKESEVMFTDGLNILSGETGAGKSIILGSIRLALGAKADKDFIRHGEEYSLIELVFRTDNRIIEDRLRSLDLPVESDGTIFIQRKIMDGRSTAKINGETVTGRALKQIASMLISIHGQNDTAQLLDSRNYLDILDDYAGSSIEETLQKVQEDYDNYISLKNELEEAKKRAGNRDRDLELAQFEVAEIENARLKVGEDEELEAEYRRMNNSRKIADSINKAYSALENEQGALTLVDIALRELRFVQSYDEQGLSDIESGLSTAEDILSDVRRSMSDYMSDMEFSEEEYREVESRLDIINHLKNKYGDTIEKVIEYGQNAREQIDRMSDYDAYLEELEGRINKRYKELVSLCNELSEIRKDKAQVLTDELVRNLKELNLSDARCEVRVDSNMDNLSAKGIDAVDFMVSFNIGEPLKSLSAVASGGELSRFMLSLKTITADKEQTGTLIFDEIDAGISGKTAWNVAEKMNVIGREHQVIAITHLPQIAAMADTHFLIEKASDDVSTTTQIRRLNDNDSEHEIARLMSTDTITDVILESAKQLRAQAKNVKE